MASDAGCNQQLICAVALEKRDISTSPLAPFDPRTDVSADAKYVARRVVKHLWIIFVALPFVLTLLFLILILSAK